MTDLFKRIVLTVVLAAAAFLIINHLTEPDCGTLGVVIHEFLLYNITGEEIK